MTITGKPRIVAKCFATMRAFFISDNAHAKKYSRITALVLCQRRFHVNLLFQAFA